MKKILVLALAAMTMGGANLIAAVARDVNYVKSGEWRRAQARDLSSADLRGADFTGAWLNHAYFHGADLRGVNFTGAWLENADFSGTNINGAKFDRANLAGADFSGAKGKPYFDPKSLKGKTPWEKMIDLGARTVPLS